MVPHSYGSQWACVWGNLWRTSGTGALFFIEAQTNETQARSRAKDESYPEQWPDRQTIDVFTTEIVAFDKGVDRFPYIFIVTGQVWCIVTEGGAKFSNGSAHHDLSSKSCGLGYGQSVAQWKWWRRNLWAKKKTNVVEGVNRNSFGYWKMGKSQE